MFYLPFTFFYCLCVLLSFLSSLATYLSPCFSFLACLCLTLSPALSLPFLCACWPQSVSVSPPCLNLSLHLPIVSSSINLHHSDRMIAAVHCSVLKKLYILSFLHCPRLFVFCSRSCDGAFSGIHSQEQTPSQTSPPSTWLAHTRVSEHFVPQHLSHCITMLC